MGLAAPQVQATIVWPRATDEVPANASVWIRVTTIRAVAQLGLEVDGAAVETDVTLRHQAPAPPWPSVPMPPGWVPSPPHALYELRPPAPWTPGARASAFVRSVAVSPEPALPPHVRSVDEPVANAVHQVEVAQVPLFHHLLQPGRGRRIAILHHTKYLPARVQRLVDHALRVLPVQGHGLFDHDVPARGQHLYRLFGMQAVRRTDIDDIHLRAIRQQVIQ